MLLAYIYRSITHRVHFLDKASRDMFICGKDLFVAAMDGKGPSQAGSGASRGKSRQSGSKVRTFPLCREHRAEHFLSGVVAETGTCSSLPKICLLKPMTNE